MTSRKHAPPLRAPLMARLLGGASLAVLISYSPALAQDVNITIDSGTTAPDSVFTAADVSGFDTVNVNTQDTRDDVSSSIDDSDSDIDIGSADSSSVDNSDTDLLSTASGNTFSLTAEQLGTDGTGGSGTLGLLSGQFADGAINSSVGNSNLTIDSASGSGDAASTSLAASDNTISTTSTVNSATVVFSDDISADLAGDLAGSGEGFSQGDTEIITLDRGTLSGETELLSVEGGASVVASTQAIEGDALSSGSTIGGNTISVELGDSIGSADAEDSLVTVDGNDFRSSLTGNLANVGTDVTVDTAFDGSAGVFNQQQIGDGGTAAALTANTDASALSVTLGDSTNSSLVVSDNTIGASARGNVATLDGIGVDSILADGTSLSIDATSITADANGGRININDGGTTEFTDDTTVADGTNFGFVAGTQQAVNGGGGDITASNNNNDLSVTGTGALTGSSISVEDNTAFAIASANDGGTAIDLNATNITATAGLASDQNLTETDVTSSLGAGTAFAVSADVDGNVSDSSVLVDDNLSVAEASGNTGRTTLSADAGSALLTSSEIDRATAGFVVDDETTAVGDFALAANQSISASAPVTATANSTGTVTLGAEDGAGILTGAIADSTVSLSSNVQQATASGNTLTNGIDLDGNTIGSDEGGDFETNISAVSSLASTQQIASDVQATSENTLSLTQEFFSGTTAVADSSLLVDANENRSSATANRATNTLAVTADTTIVGADVTAATANEVVSDPGDATDGIEAAGTSALSNFQESTGTTILADTDTIATLDIGNGADATTALTDSTASISDNITTASGAANIGTSTIDLDAGTELTSNAALVNAQDSSSDVDGLATLDAGTAGTAGLEITGPVANSTVGIDDNTVIASGMGNQTANTLSVSATTIDRVEADVAGDNFLSEAAPDATADFAALNRQNQTGNITSGATADGLVSIAETTAADDGTLTDSSASLDGNQLQSDAMSNLATNSIDLTGTSAITETTAALGSLQTSGEDGGAITVNSSSDADFVFETANGVITDSSVSIDGNQAFDSATSNQAINTVSLAGNSISGQAAAFANVGVTLEPTVSSDALADNSLSSVQTGFAAVGSSSDITGRISSGGEAFSGSDASISDNFARSFGMGNTATNTLDLMAGSSVSGTSALTGTQVQIGDVASAATVGATVIDAGGGSLEDSTAAIDENIAFSRSMGNDQTNALSVEGTSITGVSGTGDGATFAALGAAPTTNRTLDADNVVTGFQGLVNGDVTGAATVTGTVDTDGIITDSSVSASDNIAQSNVTGSRGNNLLELAPDTTVTGVSVLTSGQSGRADDGETNVVSSTADLTFDVDQAGAFAPINSALNVDGNLGFSSAFGNDVTNRLDVSGTSVVGQNDALSTADVSDTGVVSGTSDNLLGNFQSRSVVTAGNDNAVTSSADLTVNLLNSSDGVTTTNSTITASDNILDSTATSNRANNTLALNADTALTAGGAIANQQTSDSPVTSDVALRTSVGSATLGDVTGSSIALRDNTGVARAAGNDAANVLNASAGTVITGGVVAGSGSSGVTAGALNATGTFATASNQVNSGAVTARASFGDMTDPTESMLGVETAALNNSSVDLSGNRLVADAVSNRVSNTISVSGRSPSEDVTTALTSRQVATGAVESRVDTFRLASTNGALDASSVGLSGNTFSASAGGNIATSRLVRD